MAYGPSNDDPYRQELLKQMRPQRPNGVVPPGGAPGLPTAPVAAPPLTPPGAPPAVPGAPPAVPSAPPAAPPAAGPAPAYKMTGFDAGKMADPGHNTPKYQIARALQGFDPKAGYTPEVLSKLNGLGVGSFTNKNDKLHVDGGSDELKGMTDWDGIKDSDGDAAWQFGVDSNLDGPADPAAAGGQGGGAGSNSTIQALIESLGGLAGGNGGSMLARIQQALVGQMGNK